MKIRHTNQEKEQIIFLLVFSLVYLYFFVRVLWRVGDEGSLVYGAQLVTEGAIPYKDFFEVMAPGSFYWLGLFFELAGTSFLVARIVLLLTGVIMTLLIFMITKRVYDGPFATLPAIFFLLIAIPSWPATSHHWDSDLFGLIAVSTFLLWQDRKNLVFIFITGLVAGITSCFIQQKGFLLILSFLLVVWIECFLDKIPWSRLLTRSTLLLVGYAGVGFTVLIYFYWIGGLSDLIYATLKFPATSYYDINKLPYGYGLSKWLFPSWQSFFMNFFCPLLSKIFSLVLSLPILIIIYLPILIIICLIFAIISPEKRRAIFNKPLLTCWFAGLALWISELHRQDLMHLIYGSPLLLVLLLLVFYYASGKYEKIRKGILYFIIVTLTLFGSYNLIMATSATYKQSTRRGTVYVFEEDKALSFLMQHIQEHENVFIYPYYPMFYFLANIKNPTRFNVLLHFPNSQEAFTETVNKLIQKKVTYVLWDTIISEVNLQNWFPAYTYPPEKELILEKYLMRNYDLVGFENGWRILRLHSSNN